MAPKFLAKTIFAALILTLVFPIAPARAAGAFDALAACINKETSTQVNVMFLIDSSGSLKFADDNKSPGSDPEGKRAEIIASSILLLERINQEKPLYFALTTFDSTSPGQNKEGKKYEEYPWTQANPENVAKASKWSEKIKDFNNGQKTDWVAGLRNAKKKLVEAPGTDGEACQAIIWFTDGGIDVGGAPADLKKSIKDLCGTIPGEGGIPQESLITTIREAGIHLIGVFLKPQVINDKNRGRVSLFEPTVLGQGVIEPGDIGQGSFTCGEFPIPDSHGQGEFIEVKNTDELAERFLKLTMQIIEGKPAFEECQSGVTNFSMDPGIKDAVLLLPSLNWKISIPGGAQVSRQALPAGWNETTQLERFSVLNVPIKSDLVGKWSINSGISSSCASVFLDAGIQPRVSKGISLTAGKSNQEFSGLLINSDGSPANLNDFRSIELSADVIDNTSQNRERKSFPLDVTKGDSSWKGLVEPYTGSNTASFLLRLDLTTKSGVKLPTIKSAVEVPLVLPDQLCKIASPTLKLSDLYTGTPAKGTLVVDGPKQGDCLLSLKSLDIKQDPEGRTIEMFKPKIFDKASGKTFGPGDEVLVKQGEQATLEVTLESEISAQGDSKGLLILKTRTADSTQSMDLVADVEFKSVLKPPSPLLISLLTLLGLLIPLSLLQLSNFLFARFRFDGIRVANVPVKVLVGDGKVTVMRLDDQKDLFEDRNFDYPSTKTDNEKSYTQDWSAHEVFKLSTRLPKNPFGEVSGVLTFDPERRGFASEEMINDFDGLSAVAPLNPNGFWVASALRGATSEASGNLTVVALITAYLNIDPSQADSQFGQIKDQIETSEDSWRQLAQIVGSSGGATDGDAFSPSSSNSTSPAVTSEQSVQPKKSTWDEIDSPAAAIPTSTPSFTESKNENKKEKKGLFGKKDKDSGKQAKSNDSTEPTQSSQVDPDDPWA